jgi:hypothetical protein
MKVYDVYVPLQSPQAAAQTGEGWAWLEKLLAEQFGGYTQTTGFHQGAWNGAQVHFTGKVRTYSVHAEEAKASPFFGQLKQRAKKMGLVDMLVVEKEAPQSQGEPAGERI